MPELKMMWSRKFAHLMVWWSLAVVIGVATQIGMWFSASQWRFETVR